MRRLEPTFPAIRCWVAALSRELDDALSLTDTGADVLADTRTGHNGRYRLAGLLRQLVFGRLAGYEDVNDARGHRFTIAQDARGCDLGSITIRNRGNAG